jgi:AcrR family transcriptional regulator
MCGESIAGYSLMPKIVDHDLQRACFAEAAMRLIARQGLEGVTMRAVASEAGLSYGSLFHYFESKEQLLIHAVRTSIGQQTQRVNAFSSQYAGLEALEHLLCDDAVTSESSRDSMLVWMAFQYQAALRESFAALNEELVDGWQERIRALLNDAKSAGEMAEAVDTDIEAGALWAYSSGIGQLGVLHPESFPPARQTALIANYLDKLRAS